MVVDTMVEFVADTPVTVIVYVPAGVGVVDVVVEPELEDVGTPEALLLHPESPPTPAAKPMSTTTASPTRINRLRANRFRRLRLKPAASTPAITAPTGAAGERGCVGAGGAAMGATDFAELFSRVEVPEAQLAALVMIVSVLVTAAVPVPLTERSE